jgi:hypothetical protein
VKGEEGSVKVHKSEDGDLEPERKGAGEEGESKMAIEVGVKTARPLGRRRGEMPMREWERSESGRK